MSHISAKSASASNDMEAYNTVIRNESAKTFFGQDLPATLAGIDPEFLTATIPSHDEPANHGTRHLLSYLDIASGTDALAGMSPIQIIL